MAVGAFAFFLSELDQPADKRLLAMLRRRLAAKGSHPSASPALASDTDLHQLAHIERQLARAADQSDPQPAAAPALDDGGSSGGDDGDSHWGRLPTEIKHRIIRMSSPLTRFGLGWLTAADLKDLAAQRDLWLEIFETEWQGDLASLPRPRAFFVNKETARMIRTREMFARVARLDWFDLWSLQHAVVRNRWEDLLDLSNHAKMAPVAAAENASSLLERLLVKKHKDYQIGWWLIEAAKYNAIDTARLLLAKLPPSADTLSVIGSVLATGSTDVIRLIFDHKPEWFARVRASSPASNGRLDAVKFLHENGVGVFDKAAMDNAIVGGYLDIVVYLHTHRTEGFNPAAVHFACSRGNAPIASYLVENRLVELSANDFNNLMQHGKPADVLPMLDSMLPPDMQISLDHAVVSGSLALVQKVLAHGNYTSTNIVTMVPIRTNNLQILKLLHKNGITVVEESALVDAAAAGSMSTIKYAAEHMAAVLPRRLIEKAAAGGHIELVKYLHEQHGQATTAFVMDNAAASGNLDLVKWLHARPKSKASKATMDKAAAGGHLAIVEFLHTHRAEGCTVKAMDKAGENGHAHVLDFLHKNRTEGFTEAMFRRAVDCDQRAAVRWILGNIDRQELDLNRAMRSALSLQLVDMCDILEAYAQSRHIKLSVKRHRD
ncbi:hypothetical protein HK105_205912 [Polyrhizophydium stewartii]|uniref:Ankyrin repeat protein n=1 Tax=Polyrhizophydium stewartii TaxID=2732419 RepID=A0ABR4N4T2_9FUNG